MLDVLGEVGFPWWGDSEPCIGGNDEGADVGCEAGVPAENEGIECANRLAAPKVDGMGSEKLTYGYVSQDRGSERHGEEVSPIVDRAADDLYGINVELGHGIALYAHVRMFINTVEG